MKLSLLLASLVVLSFVQLSVQEGTLFADTVKPVLNSATFINATKSDVITTKILDFGVLSISNLNGISFPSTGPVVLGGSALSVNVPLGFRQSAASTNFNSSGNFGANGNSISLVGDSTNVDSGNGALNLFSDTNTQVTGESVYLEGIYGFDIESTAGNVQFTSEQLISSSSDLLSLTATDSLQILSDAGTIELISGNDLSLTSNTYAQYLARYGAHFVSASDMTIQAPALVTLEGRSAFFSVLQDININSQQRSVDLRAGTLLAINADRSNLFSNQLFLTASGTNHSNIEFETVYSSYFVVSDAYFVAQDFVVSASQFQLLFQDLVVNTKQIMQIGDSTLTGEIYYQSNPNSPISFTTQLYNIQFNSATFTANANTLALSAGNSVVFDSSTQSHFSNSRTVTASSAININSQSLSFSGTTLSLSSASQTIQGSRTQITANTLSLAAKDAKFIGTGALDISGSVFSISASQSIQFIGNSLAFDASASTISISSAQISLIASNELDVSASTLINFQSPSIVANSAENILLQGTSVTATSTTLTATAANDLFLKANALSISASTTVSLSSQGDISWSSWGAVSITSSSTVTLSSVGRIAFEGNGLSIRPSTSISVTSGANILLQTLERYGGISISTANTIPITASKSISFTGYSISQVQTNQIMTFTSPVVQFTGVEALVIDSDTMNVQTTLGNIVFASDAYLNMAVLGNSQINAVNVTFGATNQYWSTGPLSLQTDMGVINGNTLDLLGTGASTSTITAGTAITLSSTSTFAPMTISNLNIQAGTGGARFMTLGDLLINTTTAGTPTSFTASSNIFLASSNSMLFSANVVSLSAPAYVATSRTGIAYNYQTIALTSGSVTQFSPTNNLRVLSNDFITTAAAQQVTINANKLNMTGTVETYLSSATLNVQSPNGPITFTTGGAFDIQGQNVYITVPVDISIEAGRAFTMYPATSAQFDALQGDIAISSAGAIRSEGAKGLTVAALNGVFGAGSANVTFVAGENIGISTANAGVLFQAQGLVDGKNALVLTTTSPRGNILFDSIYSRINLNARDNFTLSSSDELVLNSHTGFAVSPGTFLTLSSSVGSIVLTGTTNVNITAGSPLLSGNLTMNSQFVDVIAQDMITLQSLGPFNGNGLSIQAGSGDIVFQTGSSQLIDVTATSDMILNAGRSFLINSTFDLSAQTNGSIAFNAQQQLTLSTVGGPITFDATTGSDGAVSLNAGQEVVIVSGSNLFGRAQRDVVWTAGNGVTMTANGEINVYASQADSTINFVAGRAISFVSTGVRNNPADGVFMTATNNIGMTASQISFNSQDSFTIGQTTRPLVVMNAGGSQSVAGITINSQGNIVMNSENALQISAGGQFNARIANGVTASSEGPMTIQTTGNQQTVVFDAQSGTTTFEGNVFTATAGDSIAFSTVGIFEINSLGTRPTDQILFSAGKVQLLSQTMTVQTVQLQTQTTQNTTMTTASNGIFQTSPGSLGVISVSATDAMTLLANSQMTFSTNLPNSPMTIETLGNSSTLSISTSRQSSPINFFAAGLLSNEANSISFTAVEGITIDSNDLQSNSDSTTGMVSIFASGNIQLNSNLSFTLVGQNGVYLQTTDVTNGVGAPINITSTGSMDFSSQGSIYIQNAPTGRGSVSFVAGNDLNLIDDNGPNQGITFTAQSNLNMITNSSISWVTSTSLTGTVAGNILFNADGKDKSGLFGLLIETTTGSVLFSSKQGTFSATGFTGVNLFAGSSTLQSDLTIASGFQGQIIGHGSDSNQDGVKIQSTTSSVSLMANQAAINMLAGSAVQIVSSAGPMTVAASGSDPSSSYGIRFASTAVNGNVDVRSLDTGTDMSFTSVEGIQMLASGAQATLTVYTPNSISISSQAGGNIVFSASSTLAVSSATTLQISAGISNFQSTGPVRFDANQISFNPPAAGTQAISITTTDNAANTNIQLLATNALSIYSSVSDSSSVVFEATSPDGADVLFASGQGSVSVDSATIHLESAASVAFESSLFIAISASSALQMAAGNQVLFSSGFAPSTTKFGVSMVSTSSATISANEIFFNGPAVHTTPGAGSLSVQSASTFLGKDIDIETNTLSIGGTTLELVSPTVFIAAKSSIQFDTKTTSITTQKLLIPFNVNAAAYGTCSYDRELVYNPSTRQLCVCTSYYFFTDSAQGTPIYLCQTLID